MKLVSSLALVAGVAALAACADDSQMAENTYDETASRTTSDYSTDLTSPSTTMPDTTDPALTSPAAPAPGTPATLPPGATRNPDGTITYPDGTIRNPDGSLARPGDGTNSTSTLPPAIPPGPTTTPPN